MFMHKQIWLFNQNANTNQPSTIDPDIYLGQTTYLMGMSYFNYVDQFNDLASKLHKIRCRLRMKRVLVCSARNVTAPEPW